ncbi:MAG: hypothetical protein Kow0029_05820 [Candidatus Rifleibacteriota bacterium]
MTEANRYFILGILIAVVSISAVSSNSWLSSAIAGLQLASLPRELRLAIDAGLIEQHECSKAFLNARCSRAEFGRKLGFMIMMTGAQPEVNLKSLAKTGIFKAYPATGKIRRKEAIEAMARACMFLSMKKLINLPEEKAVSYRDYNVPEKYTAAVSYLQKKYIVRGYPDGKLGANRLMTNREAIYFTYRLYEAVAADLMCNSENKGIRFVDIPLNHPIMDSIEKLTQAGAFDKVLLKPSFDGMSNISTLELAEILEGIFNHAEASDDPIRIKTIFSGEPSLKSVSRSQLALVLEYVLSLSESADKDFEGEDFYKDVSKDAVEFEALKKLAANGIWLGYQNKMFCGNEAVTWFEAVTALAKVVERQLKKTENNPDRLAKKEDMENLIALIKAKKAKIQKILDQKRQYKR